MISDFLDRLILKKLGTKMKFRRKTESIFYAYLLEKI
jgi:hypothetical protein